MRNLLSRESLLGFFIVVSVVLLAALDWESSAGDRSLPINESPDDPSMSRAESVPFVVVDGNARSGADSSPTFPPTPQGPALEPAQAPISPEKFCDSALEEGQWKFLATQLLADFQLETVLENFHFSMNNGQERRVQRLRNESDRLEYRFFTLDAEGFPEVWLPKDKSESSEKIFDRWRSQSEKVVHKSIREGNSQKWMAQVRVEYQNQEIQQIEFISQGLSFSCESGVCHCQ